MRYIFTIHLFIKTCYQGNIVPENNVGIKSKLKIDGVFSDILSRKSKSTITERIKE